MPRRFSVLLIGSLAANAVLLGVVVGRWLAPGQPPEQTMESQLVQRGPTSDVVDAAWASLPSADKDVLEQQLRESWTAMAEERHHLTEAGRRVYEAAVTEPFDEHKLRDAVGAFQMRENRIQQTAEDILISHLASMPAEARATAAVGLLTPFSARLNRLYHKDGAEVSSPPLGAPPPSSASATDGPG